MGTKKSRSKTRKRPSSRSSPRPSPRTELASLIRSSGFTYERLAEESGVSKSYISHVVTGRSVPSLRTAARIADALGKPLDLIRGMILAVQ